jgi:hypothetical protein
MKIYFSSIGLSLMTAHLLNKKYPTIPIGRWKLKRFMKYFSMTVLSLVVFVPILFLSIQSFKLG